MMSELRVALTAHANRYLERNAGSLSNVMFFKYLRNISFAKLNVFELP